MTEFESWIVGQGLYGTSINDLLGGAATRLLDEGVPLARAYVALPTVNPTVRVLNHTWRRGSAPVSEGIPHGHHQEAFQASPFNYMLSEGLMSHRWRLDTKDCDAFHVFAELKSHGITDYLARLVSFQNTSAPALRGIAMSFSTDREEGFSDADIERIDVVIPLLALAAYRIAVLDLTIGVLDTYVGLSAGRRVLSGEMRRGSGETLHAALFFADLRGFTALVDSTVDSQSLVVRLDAHFEAMAQSISRRGGDVLKFMGDGLLAAFPVTDEHSLEWACRQAVDAAVEAIDLNEKVNIRHAPQTRLPLDITLHAGEVYYGNVGAKDRLDFTVIGAAVNEASRMEALCATIGCSLVMSLSVAQACGREAKSLGRWKLRGVAEEQELFTLAGATARA